MINKVYKQNYQIHQIYWILVLWFPAKLYNGMKIQAGQRFFLMFILTLLLSAYLLKVVSKTEIEISRTFLYNSIIYLIILISYFMTTSLIFSATLDASDFIEFVRPLFYFSFLMFPLLFPLNQAYFKKILSFLIFMFICQVLFSFLVYVPISYPLVDLFKGRTHEELRHFSRFTGTFGFPSLFSSYMAFFLMYAILNLLFIRRRNLGKAPLLSSTIIVILFSIGLIMTAGRTGLLIFSTMLLLLFVYEFLIKMNFKILLLPIIIFSIMLSGFLVLRSFDKFELQYNYLINTVNFVEGDSTEDTGQYRAAEIERTFNYAKEYFPLGFGSNKTYFTQKYSSIESFYAQYLSKYGVIGILLIYLSFCYFIFKSIKVLKDNSFDSSVKNFALTFLLWTVVVLIVGGWVHAPTDQFRGSLIYYGFAGYLIMILHFKKKEINDEENTQKDT